jgi:hypothetical protein
VRKPKFIVIIIKNKNIYKRESTDKLTMFQSTLTFLYVTPIPTPKAAKRK